MNEDEANKKLEEAVHQIAKAVCLLRISRDSIEYVATKMDWDIEALYDVDEAMKHLACSLADINTLDTDLAYINDF